MKKNLGILVILVLMGMVFVGCSNAASGNDKIIIKTIAFTGSKAGDVKTFFYGNGMGLDEGTDGTWTGNSFTFSGNSSEMTQAVFTAEAESLIAGIKIIPGVSTATYTRSGNVLSVAVN